MELVETDHQQNTSPSGTLVVVEPNARGFGGHYLDYALSFRKAVGELGVSSIMLAARDADPEIVPEFLYPTFRYGFWDGYPLTRDSARTPAKLAYRAISGLATHLYYHPLVFAWARESRLSPKAWLGRLFSAPMLLVCWIAKYAIPYETKLIRGIRSVAARRRLVKMSLVELRRALDTLGVDKPILFFTTAGENELQLARRFLERNQYARAIVMVRKPLFFLSESENFDDAMNSSRDGRFVKEMELVQRRVPNRFRFATDTEQLASMYNQIGLTPFQTLPIPHVIAPAQSAERSQIQISYLGDARTEKGFLALPEIVEAAATSRYADSIKFFIQSNFNIPGGEPGIAAALATLKNSYSDIVEFADQPLPREKYVAQIARSDVILLLYDRDLYRDRSSGIVVEALSAGTVPMLPSGSWLESACADILAEDRAAACKMLEVVAHSKSAGVLGHGCSTSPSDARHPIQMQLGTGGAILPDGNFYVAAHKKGQIVFSLPSCPIDSLMISFSSFLVAAGHIFDIEIESLGAYREVLDRRRRQKYIYRPSSALDAQNDPDRVEEIIDVSGGARFLRLTFINCFSGRELVISDAQIIALRRRSDAARAPQGALVYGDLDEVPDLLLDYIARRLASQKAERRTWKGSAFHNPKTFARKLVDAIPAAVGSPTVKTHNQ